MDNNQVEQQDKCPESPPKPPDMIRPTCPECGADPLELKRLRYDFKDGVVVETLFCANLECRIVVGAQIVGVERMKPPS